MTNCPNCGGELRQIPAGISKKTGKPYNAFNVCVKECGWKEPRPSTYSYTPRASKVEQVGQMQANKAKFIEEAQGRKDGSIAWFNSTNSAIQMVEVCKDKILSSDRESIQQEIRLWRNWFMAEWLNKPPF